MPRGGEPGRGLAFYRRGRLALAVAPGFGAVRGPLAGSVLRSSDSFHGRAYELEDLPALQEAVGSAADLEDLQARLGALGYEARPTPLSALASLL